MAGEPREHLAAGVTVVAPATAAGVTLSTVKLAEPLLRVGDGHTLLNSKSAISSPGPVAVSDPAQPAALNHILTTAPGRVGSCRVASSPLAASRAGSACLDRHEAMDLAVTQAVREGDPFCPSPAPAAIARSGPSHPARSGESGSPAPSSHSV
jgi:hypothetical protein